MPTTGVFNGSSIGVYFDGVLIALGKTCTLNANADEMDVTSKDSALWGEFRPTVKHWDVSCDHLMKLDGTNNVDALTDKLIAGTSVALRFSTKHSGGSTHGDNYWYGTAYVVSISMNAAQNEPASFTVNFKGTSTLTNSTRT
jgi:predicted secreted protein